MYPYMMLRDSIDIVYSQIIEIDGIIGEEYMLDIAISITEFIIDYQGGWVTALIVIFLILAFMIAFSEYRQQLWSYVSHPRNKWYFVSLILFTIALIIIASKHLAPLPGLIVISILWILYLGDCVVSLAAVCGDYSKKGKLINRLRSAELYRLRKYLNDGLTLEHVGFFSDQNIYEKPGKGTPVKIKLLHLFVDCDVKLSYQFLKADYLFNTDDVVNAYKTLSSINRKLLYPEEARVLDLDRAYFLAFMGDINAAKQLLGDPNKNTSRDPNVWMSYAFIAEAQGDIETAYEFASKSKSLAEVEEIPEWELAQIFNNYSRFTLFIGNHTETIQYLDRAWDKIKNGHSVKLIHIIGSNRILRKAIEGYSEEECYSELQDYKDRVSKCSISNSVEIENCRICLGRQFSDDATVYHLIKNGYHDLIGQLNIHQRELFKASTFRMLMNGLFVHDWFDSEISLDINSYLILTLEERLRVFKEYIGILTEIDFVSMRNQEPYKSLYNLIVTYYKDSAIKEIDEELAKTESYCVYRQNELMKFKLGILRIIEGPEHLDKSKRLYLDQYGILNNAGLKIEATYALLLMMDECTSSYSVKLQTTQLMPMSGPYGLMLAYVPTWSGYFEDFIQGILDTAPPPTILDDNIHMSYSQINFENPYIITPVHDDIIKEYIHTAIQDFDSLKSHPCKLEMSIEIAHLCRVIKEHEDVVKRMLGFFKRSNVNIRQFAAWVRFDVEALEHEMGQEGINHSLV